VTVLEVGNGLGVLGCGGVVWGWVGWGVEGVGVIGWGGWGWGLFWSCLWVFAGGGGVGLVVCFWCVVGVFGGGGGCCFVLGWVVCGVLVVWGVFGVGVVLWRVVFCFFFFFVVPNKQTHVGTKITRGRRRRDGAKGVPIT